MKYAQSTLVTMTGLVNNRLHHQRSSSSSAAAAAAAVAQHSSALCSSLLLLLLLVSGSCMLTCWTPSAVGHVTGRCPWRHSLDRFLLSSRLAMVLRWTSSGPSAMHRARDQAYSAASGLSWLRPRAPCAYMIIIIVIIIIITQTSTQQCSITFMRWWQLRCEFHSTAVWRAFDCLSKVIKCTET